jgi:hypothetical protein
MIVQLLDSRGKVGSCLVLDETFTTSAARVTLTADFAVDDVEAGLAREVFKVLYVSVSDDKCTLEA